MAGKLSSQLITANQRFLDLSSVKGYDHPYRETPGSATGSGEWC